MARVTISVSTTHAGLIDCVRRREKAVESREQATNEISDLACRGRDGGCFVIGSCDGGPIQL